MGRVLARARELDRCYIWMRSYVEETKEYEGLLNDLESIYEQLDRVVERVVEQTEEASRRED